MRWPLIDGKEKKIKELESKIKKLGASGGRTVTTPAGEDDEGDTSNALADALAPLRN